MKKEKKVYVVYADDVDNFYDITKKEVIAHCTKTKNIYTLELFEDALNSGEYNADNSFIRIY